MLLFLDDLLEELFDAGESSNVREALSASPNGQAWGVVDDLSLPFPEAIEIHPLRGHGEGHDLFGREGRESLDGFHGLPQCFIIGSG